MLNYVTVDPTAAFTAQQPLDQVAYYIGYAREQLHATNLPCLTRRQTSILFSKLIEVGRLRYSKRLLSFPQMS